ncbi:MAG: hypothetical protein ABI180_01085 [Microcoleus sp.]
MNQANCDRTADAACWSQNPEGTEGPINGQSTALIIGSNGVPDTAGDRKSEVRHGPWGLPEADEEAH